MKYTFLTKVVLYEIKQMFLPADGNIIIAKGKKEVRMLKSNRIINMKGDDEDQKKNNANSYINNRHRFLHSDDSIF